MFRISKVLLVLVVLCGIPALGNNNPSGKSKKPKKSLISVTEKSGYNNVITLESTDQLKNISFVIADAQGIIKMFGENYRTGASINVNHLARGYYTIIFSKEFSSSVGHFTVH